MRKSLISIVLFLPILLQAQYINPNAGYVFQDSEVPKFEISINPQFLNEILAEGNEESDIEYNSDFTFRKTNSAEFLSGVGFRLRGNTSRYSAKKSFKISVNAFEKGRDFRGLEKINLNGEHNDPSIIRSKISWDLMLAAGAIATRANHVELYINGSYKGLYMHVEHIDEEFIEERFGEKEGNLFKCLYPADLAYLGPNPNSYKLENNGRRVYELKTNESADNYTGLANFIITLNTAQDANFVSIIEEVLDVNSFLRALAVEVLIGHWDNYSLNQNNYYLYESPVDGKFYYIPYDLDNTFGIDWFNEDWAEWNIYEWFFSGNDRPLIRRVMDQPKYRRAFTEIMRDLLENHFHPDILFPRIDELKSMIQVSAENDLFRTEDYGFTIEEFNESYTSSLPYFHVRYGLKEFAARRYETAMEQLEIISAVTNQPDVRWRVYPNPSRGELIIDAEHPGFSANVGLYDLKGLLIDRIEMSEKTFRWQLPESIKPGMYILKIEGHSGYAFSSKITFSN